MSVVASTFVGIQIEGNLIAPDITAEMLAGTIKGQAPEDFNFTKTDKLADEIAIAWGDAKAYWAAFQRALARLPENDLATTVTREQWVVPLLRSLGYDPVYTAKAEVIDGQTFALSHRTDPGEDKPPIHVVGCRVKLEQRPPSGTPRLSAHALMQEYLNRTEHLWGIVTNGLQWRLLRDSSLMTRLTYIEFDLEQILNNENFAEFGLFYRLFHRSRLPQGADDADACLLEYYHQEAIQQGGRVRDRLRDGVEKALVLLGTGFLQHPNNGKLRQSFESGELADTVYYRQLLLLIYRLLFLMVAEARNLLLTDEDPEKARIYLEYYSVTRLRNLAERPSYRREGFQDLWQGLRVTFRLFDENWRGRELKLSPLNGDLFGSKTLKHLDEYAIDNHELLLAIRQLSLYEQKGQSRRVNYAALDVEELGSVYESLLDFHPQIQLRQGIYEFQLVTGSDRKTTGSYYTPPELVGQLIKSALEPVIEEKLKEAKTVSEKEAALLSLKVCDPACGSGHFLLAAARRIGKELAIARTGEAQPGVEPLRKAIRDVVQNCIYGVDLNPLAVDLCKVALWIEGFNRGFPLNFLDHRIKCGNSLVGVLDLACLDEGIPDEAFKPVTGDDKQLASRWKKENKKQRETDLEGQLSLDFEGNLEQDRSHYAQTAKEVGAIAEITTGDVRQKQTQYQQSRQDKSWWRDYSACNLWTAAFFMPLTEQNLQLLPTTAALTRLLQESKIEIQESHQSLLPTPHSLLPLIEAANKLAQEKHFFHWCLEFPEVFEADGFDCVLGNPPWERIKLQEKEFFASRSAEIANAANKAAREKLIKELPKTNSMLAQAFEEAKHDAEAQSKFIRESVRFPLTAVGDINTYAVFAETMRKLISPNGRLGVIVPTGIATDDTCKKFFGDLIQNQALVSLYDFENREALFTAVHRSYKFSLLAISGKAIAQGNFAFFLTQQRQLDNPARLFKLSPQDIASLNPNTLTCPVFRTRTDAEITKKIYQRVPVLENERTEVNPWGISFMTMFHMSNDSGLFVMGVGSSELGVGSSKLGVVNENLVPLYEAKMFHQFDHRWATYEGVGSSELGVETRDVTLEEKCDSNYRVKPRYWVNRNEVENKLSDKWKKGWLLAFRDICRATDERTAIFSLVPKVAVNHKAPLLFTSQNKPEFYCLLIANLNSLVLDYVTRQKIGGTSLSYFILKQLPVIPPEAYTQEDIKFISSRVLELVYTTWDMQPFAQDVWRELGVGSREVVIKEWESNYGQSIYSFLSRFNGLARGDESSRNVLCPNERVSQRGNLRDDLTNPQSSSFDTSEHSGGLRKGESGRIHSISEDSSRLAQGTGDSSNLSRTSETNNESSSRSNSEAMRNSGQNASFFNSLTPEQKLEFFLTTPHSPLPIPPFIWNSERRALLRAELDAYYAKLYGLTRDELRYILDPADVYGSDFPSETFRVLKNNEIKQFGEYRTQRLVLEAWDRMFG